MGKSRTPACRAGGGGPKVGANPLSVEAQAPLAPARQLTPQATKELSVCAPQRLDVRYALAMIVAMLVVAIARAWRRRRSPTAGGVGGRPPPRGDPAATPHRRTPLPTRAALARRSHGDPARGRARRPSRTRSTRPTASRASLTATAAATAASTTPATTARAPSATRCAAAGCSSGPLHSSAFMSWGERRPRPVDHRLHEPRPRVRRDRGPALRHLRARASGVRAGARAPRSSRAYTARHPEGL